MKAITQAQPRARILYGTVPRRFPEYAFCVFGVLLLSRAVLPVIEGTQSQGRNLAEQSWLYTVLLAGFYVVIVGLLYRHRKIRVVPLILREHGMLVAVLIIVSVSVLWSVQPAFTFRRIIALFGTTLFGLYLALCMRPRQVLAILVWATLIGAVTSAAFAAINPDAGIQWARGGGLRGVYQHQNSFGVAMALGFAATVGLVIMRGRLGALTFLALPSLMAMVLLSQAATAIIICAFLSFLLPFVAIIRLQPMSTPLRAVLALALLSCVGFIGIYYAEAIVNAVGRDLTLTGRTFIWAALIDMLHQANPWFGFGYGAFWYNPSLTTALHGYPGLGWGPRHAHSGWMETLLDVGYVGCLMVAVLILSVVYRSSREALQDRQQSWVVVILFMLLMADIQNSIILDHSVFWAVFVYLAIRPRAPSGPKQLRQPASLVHTHRGSLLDSGSSNA